MNRLLALKAHHGSQHGRGRRRKQIPLWAIVENSFAIVIVLCKILPVAFVTQEKSEFVEDQKLGRTGWYSD